MSTPEFQVFAKAVDASKLVLSPDNEDKADKPYLKENKSVSLTGSSEMVKLTNAALNAVTVLSFLGGAGGIGFASGVVFFQGLLPSADAQAKAIEALANAFKEEKVATALSKQMAKLKSLSNWIQLREETWKQPNPDLAAFKSEDAKRLETEVSGGSDSLATEVTYLETAIMSWDKPETRIAVLLSYTLLFVCYSLICRLHAESAIIEAKKPDKDEKIMRSEMASFRAWLRVFRNDLKAKADSYQKQLSSIIDTRRKQIQWKGSNTVGLGAATSYEWVWKDEFSGKEGRHPYFIAFFNSNADEKEKEARDAMATYTTGFESHVVRACNNDTVIVNNWYGLVEQCGGLLQAPTPMVPPAVSATTTTVGNPHPALRDASVKYVSYAYNLGTADDGFSGLSPWTDWILIPREGDKVQLHAITLKDGGYFLETKRRVYRDVLKEEKDEGSRKPGSGVEIEKLLADETEKYSGPQSWIDTEPEVHGGKRTA